VGEKEACRGRKRGGGEVGWLWRAEDGGGEQGSVLKVSAIGSGTSVGHRANEAWPCFRNSGCL